MWQNFAWQQNSMQIYPWDEGKKNSSPYHYNKQKKKKKGKEKTELAGSLQLSVTSSQLQVQRKCFLPNASGRKGRKKAGVAELYTGNA